MAGNDTIIDFFLYIVSGKGYSLLSLWLSLSVGRGGSFLEYPDVCCGGALGSGAGWRGAVLIKVPPVICVPTIARVDWTMPTGEEIFTLEFWEIDVLTMPVVFVLATLPTTRAVGGCPLEEGTNNNWPTLDGGFKVTNWPDEFWLIFTPAAVVRWIATRPPACKDALWFLAAEKRKIMFSLKI